MLQSATFSRLQRAVQLATSRNDLVLAVFLVAVIFMMVLPLPTWLVDALIGVNMTISAMLLMVAMYLPSPLAFSSFPSVLLVTTLLRLGIAIATTRLILLQGDAGRIIDTFGHFVVGGNLVVGLVVFLILSIVQFVVIARGAERVAEVAARFSLDAMPGKQMSIDGDMRAGTIDMEEARRRRACVEKEGQLYGALDGAMKFVKGDAIAGLIIVAVNLLGGMVIGMLQRGMAAADAARTYSVLTIGDGLITQIPALFIAICAGLIVTRVQTGDGPSNVGRDMAAQVLAQPRALLIAAAVALQTGLDAERLDAELCRIRRALYGDLGVPFPRVELCFNEALPPGSYQLLLSEVPVAQGRLRPGYLLVRETEAHLQPLQIRCESDRPFLPHIPTLWVSDTLRDTLARAGIGCMDSSQVLSCHLDCVLRKYAADFIGIQETRFLLGAMEERFPDLVKESARVLPIQKIAEVLQRLVAEDISVRNLRAILESLIEWGQKEKDAVLLTEYVRIALKRQISHQHAGDDKLLPAYLLAPAVEDLVRGAIRQTSAGSYLALDPAVGQALLANIGKTVGEIGAGAQRPVLLTSMDIRRYLRTMVEPQPYALPVLSYQELTQEINIQPLARVDL